MKAMWLERIWEERPWKQHRQRQNELLHRRNRLILDMSTENAKRIRRQADWARYMQDNDPPERKGEQHVQAACNDHGRTDRP